MLNETFESLLILLVFKCLLLNLLLKAAENFSYLTAKKQTDHKYVRPVTQNISCKLSKNCYELMSKRTI